MRSRRKKDKAVSFFENDSEKILEQFQLPVQQDKTKNKILVFVSQEPFLYLEFNKPNKQNVYEIKLFKKFNFSQSQNNCSHTD